MRIDFHKNFEKAFAKLSPRQKQRVKEIIQLFIQNPHDPLLDNHALHGKEKEKRSISAGGNLRLIFKEKNNYEIVVFVRVGTHSQLY
ncbi:MAG: type II toxin-antitoxin system mRNA interferase toxin, RelE/StbE family [Candidatus Omnitrophota bacterium]|jgi:addiction module RelE/StbE family toxin|nr:MAG: type II toxin-antitoxin system mRNA interferase toxin, RelE/StbE family [Candidatus Omnitrophota bacterium]